MNNGAYLDRIINYSLDLLNNNASLATVTKQEYEILQLKNDELHDRSLIESVIKQLNDSNASSNLKRESKAYSYKDQLAEMELRKEIEAKKKEKAQSITYTLDELRKHMSKKQVELLDLQIQKENKIKAEMKRLDNLINKTSSILVRVIESNSDNVKSYIASVITTLVKYARSPLCGPYIFKVLDSLAVYLVDKKQILDNKSKALAFYKSIVNNFFRLVDNSFFIEKRWMEEPLDKAYPRIVQTLRSDLDNVEDVEFIDLAESSFFYLFLKVNIL